MADDEVEPSVTSAMESSLDILRLPSAILRSISLPPLVEGRFVRSPYSLRTFYVGLELSLSIF